MVKTQKYSSKIPLFSSKVKAGFPSPVDSSVERQLDLNDLMVQHPASTFFVRVAGDSMTGVGIREDDILVVDRSMTANSGDIILAILNGEFTVKKLQKEKAGVKLLPENPKYAPIEIRESDDFEVWGLVTYVIKQVK
jgi:DNA polymerase V